MKLKFLGFTLLWCLVSAVAMAEDFSSQLEKLGIPKEKIEGLFKDGIDSCDTLNLLEKEERLKSLKDAGLNTGEAAKVRKLCSPPESPKISVSCSTELDKKSELDLLNCLGADPQNIAVLQTLQGKPLVQKATAKTPKWAVVNEDKKLNAEVTHKYLIFLNKETSATQKSFQNKQTVPIEVALDMESGEWTHPLFDGKFITDGLDEFEIDWSNVPLEVMKALLWARVSGHKQFYKNLDGATAQDIAQKAAAKPLSDGVIKKIVDDYKLAVEEKDPVAMSVDFKKKR